jgi:hypothetical protein
LHSRVTPIQQGPSRCDKSQSPQGVEGQPPCDQIQRMPSRLGEDSDVRPSGTRSRQQHTSARSARFARRDTAASSPDHESERSLRFETLVHECTSVSNENVYREQFKCLATNQQPLAQSHTAQTGPVPYPLSAYIAAFLFFPAGTQRLPTSEYVQLVPCIHL